MADAAQIRDEVRAFILEQFLRGEDPSTLADDTPLASGGILTSIDNIKLVAFLEDHYAIAIDAHEIIGGPLDSVAAIVSTVLAKRGA
jgi:acyl carrier protein